MHEDVLEFRDADADYHAFIAIHSTLRGPAIGGTRMRPYASDDEARSDALLLSEAMSRKTALAGLAAGGGKSVIIEPPVARSREALLRAHGRVIESLGGRYITAPDVGISPADLDAIARETRHVARHHVTGGVDGSDTARGTLAAIRAAVRYRYDRDSLDGTTVAIQGCGNVGAHLAALLADAGATVHVADVDRVRAAAVAATAGARVIDADEFLAAAVDVIAPCALGGVLDHQSVRSVRASVICGAANNQLASPDVAQLLMAQGTLFVPDIVASAGGVIAGYSAIEGLDRDQIFARIDAIEETVAQLLADAARLGVTPDDAALGRADALLRRS